MSQGMGSAAAESLSPGLLMGASESFRAMAARIPSVARAQRTTLVSGPTGSGKDLIARTLHYHSSRRDRPFVTVHCAALPETLVEAEMFGHARGAFTGATQARPGLIRTAANGTLFLDEIDSLPLGAQAKLLRFLEAGEYRAVGSDHVEHSNAWVIAATNQDLQERVRQGTFRADLMFRLVVVKIDVPPLAERKADILYLADHFLERTSDGNKRFAEDARQALLGYDWPGNVRELKHRVESAALFSAGAEIDTGALNLRPPAPREASLLDESRGGTLEHQLWHLVQEQGFTLSQAMYACERLLVQAALRAENNNRTRAAVRLGIHVRTIFKKLTS
jgi:DNA-binding NtrC family response regulator